MAGTLFFLDEMHVMDTVYIETSIVSHATAWPSSDPATAVLQQQARLWWDDESSNFLLRTSQFVVDEASLGDPDAAARRLELLEGIELIPTTDQVQLIADELINRSVMPEKARLDAFHVASAAAGGVKYLLTQNCRHIANAHELPRLYQTLDDLGVTRPLICTPAEFLGGPDDET